MKACEPLVCVTARQHDIHGIALEDRKSYCREAVLDAVRSWDPRRTANWRTYVNKVLLNRMIDLRRKSFSRNERIMRDAGSIEDEINAVDLGAPSETVITHRIGFEQALDVAVQGFRAKALTEGPQRIAFGQYVRDSWPFLSGVVTDHLDGDPTLFGSGAKETEAALSACCLLVRLVMREIGEGAEIDTIGTKLDASPKLTRLILVALQDLVKSA